MKATVSYEAPTKEQLEDIKQQMLEDIYSMFYRLEIQYDLV